MKTLLFILSAFTLSAAPFPSSTWVLYSFANGQQYKPSAAFGSGSDAATFAFQSTKKPYAAFLTTTIDTNVLGDLTGKTITATINLSVTGSPLFLFGGQGDWNNGSAPPHTRLYISTNPAPFNLNESVQNENGHWWSQVGWTEVTNNMGTVIITDTFDPTHWSNANGHLASESPAYTAAFNKAVANVRGSGVSYGGGSFNDVGIAVIQNTGSATFHLISYDVQ